MYKFKMQPNRKKLLTIAIVIVTLIVVIGTIIGATSKLSSTKDVESQKQSEIQLMSTIDIGETSFKIELQSDAKTLNIGEEVKVNIYVKGGSTAYFDGYLSYDENIFETFKRTNIEINPNLEEETWC